MKIEDSQNDVPDALTRKIEDSRRRLRAERPRVYEKLMQYLEAEQDPARRGMSLIDFAYGFDCNFSCEHCCTDIFKAEFGHRRMSLEQVKRVADEADALGVFVFSLIGGEPLVWTDLDDLVRTIDPSRFHVSVTTNGWLLTAECARHLASIGISKVNVSIDSGFPAEHDAFRGRNGSHARAIAAVSHSLAAGLNAQISTVVTHQNLHSEGFQRLLDLSKELDVCLDVQVATPVGKWLGKLDGLVDAADAQHLRDLRARYPLLRRDVFSTPGALGGCPAVTGSLYIIPSGDVLPCLFIHISLGNVLREPLAEIRERGLRVPELRDYSSVCLAGEQCAFFSKCMTKTFSAASLPLNYQDAFDRF